MRHAVEARRLLEEAAAALGLSPSLVDDIFRDVPLDFPVIITSHLPLFVDRIGMSGITLFGRVYLLERSACMSREFVVLLRHEAEHVRQQRESILFYPRYLFGWLRAFARELLPRRRRAGTARGADTGRAPAWFRAYRNIVAEQEAYGAGARARRMLDTQK